MPRHTQQWRNHLGLAGLVGLALVATFALSTSPQPAQADCSEASTCANFMDENGVLIEVCESGFLQFWAGERQADRTFYRVPE